MLENFDLKPMENECLNETCEGLDEIKYYEVYRNGKLVLYEYENFETDSIIPEDVVNEIFPEFKTDSTKGYLIEEDGKFFI